MWNILAMGEQETNYTNTFLHNVNYRQQEFTEITPQNKCLGSALSVGVIMQKNAFIGKTWCPFLKNVFHAPNVSFAFSLSFVTCIFLHHKVSFCLLHSRLRQISELMVNTILGPNTSIGGQEWKWRAAEFGLQVFKYTIEALTQGQGEFTKMVCRLLKRLMKRKIQVISIRAISVLTRLQVLQLIKTLKDRHDSVSVSFKYFGKCEKYLFFLSVYKFQRILVAFLQCSLQILASCPPLSASKLLNHLP